jgi:hypothetical protein
MFYLNPCIEGEKSEDWMVVDCGDIYIHVFSDKGREYYDVERKWAFQKVEQFEPLNSLSQKLNSGDSKQGVLKDEGGEYAFTVERE